MKKITCLLFLIAYISSYSQNHVEGYIYDKTNNQPLPYATIKLVKGKTYTITNEDGKFEIEEINALDSLEVRYLGFEPKKVSASYFLKNPNLYLSPYISSLDEVIVVANKNHDKNYAYNLLNSLIQKYRNSKSIIESKAFLSLTSSARNTPIEQIEGFYNSTQSLSEGIIDLKIKSGRFGQNKSFPFYSLDNTTILKDFQFFKTSNQILPSFPGNMSPISVKNKYIVKVEECNSCNDEDVSISFEPKKFNGRFFYGNIIFNKEKLIIKKIELGINDPITKGLSAITKGDIITPKEIQLNIVFNPIDFEKIQYLDFTFITYYDSGGSIEVIKSHSLLYFYDYNNSFTSPYFVNSIDFNNDYDKIMALQASDDFWNLNYQFPKSYNEKMSMDFLKKYGYLINYSNTIPQYYIEIIKPSIIIWNKDKQIEWRSIKQELTSNKKEINFTGHNQGVTIEANKTAHSITELKDKKNIHREVLNFNYILDVYKNKKGKEQFITRTISDRNSSYYSKNRTSNKLIYINLIFDIYEYYRQTLHTEITNKTTFEEVKTMCNNKFEEASITVNKMKKETNYGSNYQTLVRWNNKVASKLEFNSK